MTAPPIIASDDPAEAERLRKLLGRKFSMTDVKAAAKTPVEKTPEPVAPAAEPAHEVAAAEAPPELSQTGSPSPSPEQSMQPETTKNAFAQTQAAASVRVPQA
ncbi:MAG: hypothetical protein HKP58_14900, partial [Desulfatitalea sp.]|nr:hypothetical protein [Desulfatitalea sp.]NNK01696.1 hypothetical protein [Desulfatitalea sp.]